MIIKRVRLKNYKSYKDVDLEFEGKDLIGIIGTYEDNEEKSNGAGKSGLMESFLFITHNYDIRHGTIITYGASFCEGSLTFVQDEEENAPEYTITRHITTDGKHKLMLYHGKEPIDGNKKDLQNMINQLTGISKPTLFTYINFFTYDMDTIIKATPAKRAEILTKDLLNTNKFKVYRKLIYDLRKEIEINLAALQTENKTLTQKLEELDEKNLSDNEEVLKADVIRLQEEIATLIDNVKQIEIKIESIRSNEDNLKKLQLLNNQKTAITTAYSNIIHYRDNTLEIIKQSQEHLDAEQKNLERNKEVFYRLFGTKNALMDATEDINVTMDKILKNITEAIQNISKKKNEAIQIKNNIDAHYLMISNQINTLSSIQANCPTCTKPMEAGEKEIITKDLKNKLAMVGAEKTNIDNEYNDLVKAETNLSQKVNEFNTISSEIRHCTDMINTHTGTLNVNQTQLKSLAKQLNDNENSGKEVDAQIRMLEIEVNKNAEYKEGMKDAQNLSNRKLEIETLINNKQNEIISVKESLAEYKVLSEQKKSIKEVIKNNSIKEQDIQSKLEIYNVLYTAYGPEGVQSMLLEEVMKNVEIDANNVLSKINPDKQIKVIVEKTDNSSDISRTIAFSIFRKKFDCYVPYEDLSLGEKCYVNFALRMGFSKYLTEQETPIKFVVADELVGNLDKVNKIYIFKILNFMRDYFSQIFFISHDDIAKKLPYIVHTVMNEETGISKVHIFTNKDKDKEFYKLIHTNI